MYVPRLTLEVCFLHSSAKGRKFSLFIDYGSSDEGEGEDVLSGV